MIIWHNEKPPFLFYLNLLLKYGMRSFMCNKNGVQWYKFTATREVQQLSIFLQVNHVIDLQNISQHYQEGLNKKTISIVRSFLTTRIKVYRSC